MAPPKHHRPHQVGERQNVQSEHRVNPDNLTAKKIPSCFCCRGTRALILFLFACQFHVDEISPPLNKVTFHSSVFLRAKPCRHGRTPPLPPSTPTLHPQAKTSCTLMTERNSCGTFPSKYDLNPKGMINPCNRVPRQTNHLLHRRFAITRGMRAQHVEAWFCHDQEQWLWQIQTPGGAWTDLTSEISSSGTACEDAL